MPHSATTAAPADGHAHADAGGALHVGPPVARTFGPRPQAYTERAATCMADFLDHFGLPPGQALLAAGGGNSFSDMGTRLLRDLDPPLPAVDLLALAFHTPDLDFVKVAGCALAAQCAGRPDVFSVSGQGVGAPFTALRALAALHASGQGESGALFVFDQTTLPYPEPDLHGGGRDDGGVLLPVASRPGERSARLVFTDERPVDGPRQTRAALREAPGTPLYVLGATLARHLADGEPVGEAVEGSARQLCTSAWAALAGLWAGLAPGRLVVVADHDPHAGRLFQAGLLPEGAP